MIWIGGQAQSSEEGYAKAKEILSSGQALKAFEEFCDYQGPAKLDDLPVAPHQHIVKAPKTGFVTGLNTEKIGWANVELGAGRKNTTDSIDHSVGIEFCTRIGLEVQQGQPLFILHGQHTKVFEKVEALLLKAVELQATPPSNTPPLIAKVL